MAELNKKYDIKIEVLTPLCIGAGAEKDWVKGADFVEKNGKVYKLNLRKMVNAGVDVSKLTSLIAEKNSDAVLRLLGNKLEKVSDSSFNSPNATNNDIKSFIKNELSGNPIIPGSSLKGAIRSVLFQYLGGKSKDGKEVLGSSTKGDEFMRFIKLTDVEFEKTELVNTKIFNLQGGDRNWQGGWKHAGGRNSQTDGHFRSTGFNTIYESIPPTQSAFGYIMLSDTTFNLYGKENGHIKAAEKQNILDVTTLFTIINNHTKSYLQKELDFFEKYRTDKSDQIIDGINGLLSQIPSDNSFCILKMSAGSGFHSITGDWQFDDFSISDVREERGKHTSYLNGKKSAKSRKIALYGNDFSLMGFIKVGILSESEKQEKEIIDKERLAKLEQDSKDAAKKRSEEEKVAKELQQKHENYKDLVQKAQISNGNKDYEKSLSLYNRAANIYPEGKKHIDAIKELESIISQIKEKEKLQQKIDEDKEKEAETKAQRIKAGLALLEEKYDMGENVGQYKIKNFKLVKSKVEQWLKQSANKKIPEEQIQYLTSTLSRIYASLKENEKSKWTDMENGIWKDVKQWILDDAKIKTMFNDVVK